MGLKNYIIASAFNYGIFPYVELFAIRGPMRSRFYREGLKRRIYFPRDALRKLGITPSSLWTFFQLPLLSPIEVSEFNRAAEEYQRKYGTASLKKSGREQGKFFLRKKLIRDIIPRNPYRAHRLLMNFISLSMGARDDMNHFEIGKYTQSCYLERHFPFELVNGKILPGEKYFWTFLQGMLSTDLCHNQQMRAEVIRKNKKVHIVSRSVDEWGDYLLDNIHEMF